VVKLLPEKTWLLTFLRDPRDRIISHYYYYKIQTDAAIAKLHARDRHIVGLTRQYDFADFISLDIREIEQGFANLQTRHLASCTDYAMPQENKARQALLRTALKHLSEFNFVGIVEQFDQSLNAFQTVFGLNLDVEAITANVNQSKPQIADDIKIFDRNEVAWRRIELDQQLYQAGLRRLTG